MTNRDAPEFVGPAGEFPFESVQRQIATRRALLAAEMQRRKGTVDMPKGELVDGRYVAPHWLTQLAAASGPTIERMGLSYLANRDARQSQELSDADRYASQAHISSKPGAAYAANTRTALEREQGSNVADIPPSPQYTLAWATAGLNNASRKEMLSRLIADTEINAPIREEAKQEKRADREDRQEEALRASNATKLERQSREAMARQERESRERVALEDKRQREKDAAEMRKLVLTGQNAAAADARERRQAVKLAADGKSAAEIRDILKEQHDLRDEMKKSTSTIDALKDAETILPDATGSLVGTGIDKALGAFGVSTKGGDLSGKLKTLQAHLISMTPKLGGATSDADVRNYQQAVGQIGDSTLPNSVRLEALKQVRTITERAGKVSKERYDELETGVKPTAPHVVSVGTHRDGRRVERLSDGSLRYVN